MQGDGLALMTDLISGSFRLFVEEDECELSWYVGRGSLVCRALFVELLALKSVDRWSRRSCYDWLWK